MIHGASFPALVFLILTAPLLLLMAWGDLRYMRIRNFAVLALAGVFVVVGPFLFDWSEYGTRWMQMGGMLAITFVLTMAGVMGGGDAKMLAAMAPFVALADAGFFLMILACAMISALVTHRLFRALSAARTATPDWRSWTHAKVPMGLGLSGTLMLYLGIVALMGQ
jgi:prepilin peptidase CpaA